MAILAVLMGALAPTLSHALRGDLPEGWVEVCTRLGSKWVSIDAADNAAPAPSSTLAGDLGHCHCCPSGSGATLPQSRQDLDLPALRFEVPRLFLAAPHGAFAWQAALARAPPPLT
jgi:hypothetical protein